jgi:hypothetical protein
VEVGLGTNLWNMRSFALLRMTGGWRWGGGKSLWNMRSFALLRMTGGGGGVRDKFVEHEVLRFAQDDRGWGWDGGKSLWNMRSFALLRMTTYF